MWWSLWLHLYLTVVFITNPCTWAGGAVSDALVSRQGVAQQQQQQVTPVVVPQWWWLSSLLSLPHGHTDHTAAAAAARKLAAETHESPVRGGGAEAEAEAAAGTLSLMVPLDQLADEDDSVPSSQGAERVAKRGSVCRGPDRRRCRRGAVATITPSEVHQNWVADYLSVPESLVSFSQKQAEENVCKDLSVQLFVVDMQEPQLQPHWVRETVHLGMCPSLLQERHLGRDVWPDRVVEVKCLCQQQSCSSLYGDFRCQAVRRPIRTWVKLNRQQFVESQEIVSIGCVCVRRPSDEGGYAYLAEGITDSRPMPANTQADARQP